MKIKLLTVVIITILFLILSSCLATRNFSYMFDDLSNDLVGAEIIFIEEAVTVFHIHSPVQIENFEYVLIKIFSEDDLSDLILSITELNFSYSVLIFPPTAPSVELSIQGYCILLRYTDGSYTVIGQRSDYRYNRKSLYQNMTGRYVSDEVWLNLMSKNS